MSPEKPSETPSALRAGSYRESLRIGELLRAETVGGAVLVIAAAFAVVLANSPVSDAYFDLRDTRIGYAPWHLELTVGAWAADGLLAIFFFLVGLELKREFVAGDLRDPQRAVVPVAAAFGGVAVPALIYTAINLGTDATRGWAVPTATDIAFAVAVLAIIGSHLPTALRIFLLTLAVVDDLIAITIIAIFYTSSLSFGHLVAAAVPLALFAWLAHSRRRFFGLHAWAAWVILLPIGVVVWALVHASGVHATVAGVLLGFAVPVIRSQASGGPEAGPGLAEIFEHRFRPISTGIAVPVFAFFSAGVAVGGLNAVGATLTDTVAVGITAGLVLGKPIGIMGTTWLVTTVTRSRLDSSVRWIDMLGVSLLAGIGFTVSLLVAELSFGHSAHGEHAKVAILCASVLAALLASCILVPRNGYYRRLEAEQSVDTDGDGIPDAYESDG